MMICFLHNLACIFIIFMKSKLTVIWTSSCGLNWNEKFHKHLYINKNKNIYPRG